MYIPILFALIIFWALPEKDIQGAWQICDDNIDCRRYNGGRFMYFHDEKVYYLYMHDKEIGPAAVEEKAGFNYELKQDRVYIYRDITTDTLTVHWVREDIIDLVSLDEKDTLRLFHVE